MEEVLLYHGTSRTALSNILDKGLQPGDGWHSEVENHGVFLTYNPLAAAYWARWSAMKDIEPDGKGASVGDTKYFYRMLSRLNLLESEAIAILQISIPKSNYSNLSCDVGDLIDTNLDIEESDWEECLRQGVDLIYNGTIYPEWISVVSLENLNLEKNAEVINSEFATAYESAKSTVMEKLRLSYWDLPEDISKVTTEELRKLQTVLGELLRPGKYAGFIDDSSMFDAYPEDLRDTTHSFEEWGIDETRYTVEELDLRLRYVYELNRFNRFGDQVIDRLQCFEEYTLNSQLSTNEVTIYRALALVEGQRPRFEKQTIFPFGASQYIGSNPDKQTHRDSKYTYHSYGPHWSFVSDFQHTNAFPEYSGGRATVLEKIIPYTDVNWIYSILLIGAGADPEFEVVFNDNVFVAEDTLGEVVIPRRSTELTLDESGHEYNWWAAPIPDDLKSSFLENSLYHGTLSGTWEKIQEDGSFKPNESHGWKADKEYELRGVGTYVTPIAGHAAQYSLGILEPPGRPAEISKYRKGNPIVLRLNSEYLKDMDWFIDLRDWTPSYFTTGIIPAEAVEYVIPVDYDEIEFVDLSSPWAINWWEHSLWPLISLNFSSWESRLDDYSKVRDFWTPMIFPVGFLESQPKESRYEYRQRNGFLGLKTDPEYQTLNQEWTDWYFELQEFIHDYAITELKLTDSEIELIQEWWDEQPGVGDLLSDYTRSENMGESYEFNMWTTWWAKPKNLGDTQRPFRNYPLEDIISWKGIDLDSYERRLWRQEKYNRVAKLGRSREWWAENSVKIPLYHVTPLDQVSNILENGIEPRIGPRSNQMEIEPRVWLFGDKESVVQALMNWFGDEMIGDEWLSGYATLELDIPQDWFEQRRVEKTFEPYGEERSWEWSTTEIIPGEYLKVIETWEWDENQLLDFQSESEEVWTTHFDFEPGRIYTFEELPGDETGQVSEEYDGVGFGTSLKEDAVRHFRTLENGGYGFAGTAEDALYRAVLIDPMEENAIGIQELVTTSDLLMAYIMANMSDERYNKLVAEGMLNENRISRSARRFVGPNLLNSIEKNGLMYPSIGKEGNHRNYAMALLGRKIPHLEILNPNHIEEDETQSVYFSESEDMEIKTVSKSWGKAVTQWKEIVDWAQQHGISAHREDVLAITPEEFEQAIEIYNKVVTVACIVEISYPFDSAGEDAESLISEITTDAKVAEIFWNQLEGLWDGVVDGIYMESINHYVYYWILDWIRKLNTGLSAGVWRGQELHNIIYTQGRRTAITAYRWISLPKGQLPTRSQTKIQIQYPDVGRQFKPYQLTYGQHWSLHPTAFKETSYWIGGKKDYLIEKEVPVEDIDWFNTLISCLFFKNPEFEIITNKNVFIAETKRAEEYEITVGVAFDTTLAEIKADVDSIESHSQGTLEDITQTDWETVKQIYQKFRIPALITGEPWGGDGYSIFGVEHLQSEILEGKQIHLEFYLFMIRQINYLYDSLLSRLDGELSDIIESQRYDTELPIYRWVAIANDADYKYPSRRLYTRLSGDYESPLHADKGLKSLSYGTSWSISPDAFLQTTEYATHHYTEPPPIDYQISKIIPVSSIDWYSTLISCALWGNEPEYEIIPKSNVFLSEEITPSPPTVGDSWNNVLGQWAAITDWAENEQEWRKLSTSPPITTSEQERANEIWELITTVANKIGYMFGVGAENWSYEGIILAIDNLNFELIKNLFYYRNPELWGKSRLKTLNEIIESQKDKDTLTAYRWISLSSDKVPSWKLDKKLNRTFGPHWSLHPNAYTHTSAWDELNLDGFEVNNFVIEKEVPVTDIDWMQTFISCLLWEETPEFEIMMKSGTYIAETLEDLGSESMWAEEKTFETVDEAWDNALTEWYEIVDWAKQEQETGIRGVSATEFQQAIEVYNKLQRVARKISAPDFFGGSFDETIIEQLIDTYARDDLELKKLLIEHYGELQILTIPYLVKSKTMNYFFYYGLIEWIRMMNWRLTSLNSYGGKELDDSISSQFQKSTLKAYRWISVHNDKLPSRSISHRNYQLSYGEHWSLHPEVYTWTTEWEGVKSQQNYLIEKEVPVEDIDWFETLVSCLFFLDNPELEIIMNPMTYIAETIEEPHLYLDMDGCFADFSKDITNRVNELLQVHDVSSISSKSLRKALRKAHAIGIERVTESDFNRNLPHDPVRKRIIDRMLGKIVSEPGFFYGLEIMNQELLDDIIASGRPFSFLTAPFGNTKTDAAFIQSSEDKCAWVRDILGLDVEVITVPKEEKADYCRPGDILIDDHIATIEEWRAVGGIGILFPQEIETFERNPYNQETTSFRVEETNTMKQYPIMFKKNATGTLQQWKIDLTPISTGGYLLTTSSGQVGGSITTGRGKEITEGKATRSALQQGELEANSKFKKKQDSGYFLTQEEANQNLVLLPMKALDFKKRSHDITYPAVAQRKFDGVRCLAIPQADGSVRLMSRTGKSWTHLHHLQSQIEALNIDSNMVLDGEVYSDTLTFEEATGLVRRQTLKPGDEEKMKQIDYRLYDAILLDKPKATFLDRYSKLAALFPPASSAEGRRMGHLVLTENFPLRNREDLLALHKQFTTDEDFEGVMVRNLHGTYDINKRSKHLQKFKEFQDAEYKIVGYNEASGDWQGTPIWICQMDDGRQFNVTPTGDRPSRIEMFNNIEDYMGKLLTVKFFELTADGVPRHGVGLAIRDYE